MKIIRDFFLVLVAVAGVSMYSGATAENSSAAPMPKADWREDYAYSLGITALHYAYPYLRMAEERYRATMADVESPGVQAHHALNTFWHGTRLTDASWQKGGALNNDTVYSAAWVHVADEPIILSIPPMDRYFSFQLAGFNSDNFGYVSEKENGRKGGNYALLPRGWQGKLPVDVEPVGEVPSPWILIAGRTYVAGKDDLPAVRKLQGQYKLTPLSQWGQVHIKPPQPEVFKPYSATEDPLAVWKTINRAMAENPPVGDEAGIPDLFREIRVGPGLDVTTLDEVSKRGLARAARDGLTQIKQAQISGARNAVRVNGWRYNPSLGRAGVSGNFFQRTVHQSYAGIVANDPVEARYFAAHLGSDEKPLEGGKSYRIHIPQGAEPDADAFWSITLYDKNNNLVANPINRYSIGDRTQNLTRDEDGGLIIALQHERPTDPYVNWLPAPSGRFWLVLRVYQPGPSVLDGSWKPFSVTVAP